MKTIYLIRHGHIENTENVFYGPDVPLSPTGAKEIANIAEDLKSAECAPQFIISSPYLRARESAETIAHILGNQEVTFDERLIDWKVGDWIGKSLEAFREFAGYNTKPFKPNFDGLETYDEMAKRVLEVIHEAIDHIQDTQCAIIVSHREPLASAILKLTNQPDKNMREIRLPKGSAWKLIFENKQLTKAELAFDHSIEEK